MLGIVVPDQLPVETPSPKSASEVQRWVWNGVEYNSFERYLAAINSGAGRSAGETCVKASSSHNPGSFKLTEKV